MGGGGLLTTVLTFPLNNGTLHIIKETTKKYSVRKYFHTAVSNLQLFHTNSLYE